MAKDLLMVVPAPVIELSADKWVLDKKFVAGMLQHVQHWEGSIGCIMRRGAATIPFGAEYKPKDLPFKIAVLASTQKLELDHLQTWDIALLSGDSALDLLPRSQISASSSRIVYGIEYTHRTRLDIIRLEQTSIPKKVYRSVRTILEESRRRQALSSAKGIQANGYPAFASYRILNRNTMLYLDNRMTASMIANGTEFERRKARLESGEPLRLIHSGRLERMKGAHHLVPLAEFLHAAQLDFRLDIYGAGALAGDIAKQIVTSGLSEKVTFHGPVDFELELVPILQSKADIFVSCHLQADPSCSYIESLGCGVPIAGYSNAMWSEMLKNSKGGWSVPLGQLKALAERILSLDDDRPSVIARAYDGWSFAKRHDFHGQFQARMDHLADLAV